VKGGTIDMKGVSDIGAAQIKHTRLRCRAQHYRNMAAAIQAGDEQTIAAFPKYIPRGRPVSWYLERAERDMQASETAGDMASLLVDLEHRNQLDAMTPQQVWARLVEGQGFPGTAYRHPGWIEFLAFLIEEKVQELPYLVPKLSREQREYCQGRIRAMLEDLIEAFR
jgi:hypothetical protein